MFSDALYTCCSVLQQSLHRPAEITSSSDKTAEQCFDTCDPWIQSFHMLSAGTSYRAELKNVSHSQTVAWGIFVLRLWQPWPPKTHILCSHRETAAEKSDSCQRSRCNTWRRATENIITTEPPCFSTNTTHCSLSLLSMRWQGEPSTLSARRGLRRENLCSDEGKHEFWYNIRHKLGVPEQVVFKGRHLSINTCLEKREEENTNPWMGCIDSRANRSITVAVWLCVLTFYFISEEHIALLTRVQPPAFWHRTTSGWGQEQYGSQDLRWPESGLNQTSCMSQGNYYNISLTFSFSRIFFCENVTVVSAPRLTEAS